jgi:hypothetical protein
VFAGPLLVPTDQGATAARARSSAGPSVAITHLQRCGSVQRFDTQCKRGAGFCEATLAQIRKPPSRPLRCGGSAGGLGGSLPLGFLRTLRFVQTSVFLVALPVAHYR